MRSWTWLFLLALGAGLTVVAGPPAAAGNLSARSSAMPVRGHVHAPFVRHRNFQHHGFVLGPMAFAGPVVLPGGGEVGDSLPTIALPSDPPPQPPRPHAASERPSVETTADGVVIVRGPGSHHLLP